MRHGFLRVLPMSMASLCPMPNKWTGPLERFAGAKPDSAWGEPAERNGTTESYAWVKHTPESMDEAQTFAACRWKKPEEMFWRYAFVACEDDATRTPRAVFERHRLKGACEQRFIPRRKRGEGIDEIYWPPVQNE